MKAVGDYVDSRKEVASSGGIMMKENNIEKVVDCKVDASLIGKTVIFSEARTIQEYDCEFYPNCSNYGGDGMIIHGKEVKENYYKE